MERDGSYAKKDKSGTISTHTLTWSVTIVVLFIRHTPCISTHTLTWSVTSETRILEKSETISTHTLTWSVTSQISRS